MKRIFLAVLLGLSSPGFAKTSTDLLMCGALELGAGLLNGVASIYTDDARSNQTDVSFDVHKTLETGCVSYAVSAGLMTVASLVSMIDSRIDYEGGRTSRAVPRVITGFIAAAVLASSIGAITSGISFQYAPSASMLGTSLGSTVANWIAFAGALRWTYYMKVLELNAPDV